MKTRSRVKLSFIADETARRATFRRRKRGIMKKLKELVTLCDIKACAVIDGPFDSNLEVWPSREGVREVVSRFMEFPLLEQTKNMVDHAVCMWERIRKEEEQLKNLREENRKLELREFMFGCLQAKMITDYHYDARDLQDLQAFIDHYLNHLNRRIDILMENSESSTFNPIHDADIAYMNPIVAENPAVATAPIGIYDHIQYQNVNQQPFQYHAPVNVYDHTEYQDMNRQEPVQFQAPANFYDHIQYQDITQLEPVQFQAPTDFYDHNQHIVYDMNLNQIMNLDVNRNLNHNLNQYPNEQQSFMDQSTAYYQQMGYVGEFGIIHSMDDNLFHHHQLPTSGHMPSITTTATADLFTPNINNNLWEMRIGFE